MSLYAIAHGTSVIHGPKPWNKRSFESVLRDDLDIQDPALDTAEPNDVVTVHVDIKIWPVDIIARPNYNAKTQHLQGPFWTFKTDRVEMSYQAQDLPIDFVKDTLKAAVTSNRYDRETGGFTTTVQGHQVWCDTSREGRKIFSDTYIIMSDGDVINWKFPERWISISRADLGAIVLEGKQHIQSCFDWEKVKHDEIDDATTLAELDEIELT